MTSVQDVTAGLRLFWGVPGFLRQGLSPEEATAILRARLARRSEDFLQQARERIFPVRDSPSRRLLELVGCQYGDLERLVVREGVEGALKVLLTQGVYLTIEELKGRRPVVRGSATLHLQPPSMDNPGTAGAIMARSSGSRGRPSTIPIDLPFLRDRAVTFGSMLVARGGTSWVDGSWEVPGGSAMCRWLSLIHFGRRQARWFSQVDPAASALDPRYRWSARFLRWAAWLGGTVPPEPQYVPIGDPVPVAEWMASVLRSGSTPLLHTFPSSAVSVCRAAAQASIDLRGARFMVVGEPITAARVRAVRQAGADIVALYGSIEVGHLAYGCVAPAEVDDMHLLSDMVAMIQPGPDDAPTSLPGRALLVSTLRPTAPTIMLNVSLGDQAVLNSRSCGCPLEALGWTTHLHTVRSFEKLTAGGMTFLDFDVIRVLEEVLPARFGGGPMDYQLLEHEESDGRARLSLCAAPALGHLDERALADVFLSALGSAPGAARVMELAWRGADFLRVERSVPKTTGNGKIHHVHLQRSPATAGAPERGSRLSPIGEASRTVRR